MMVGYDFGKLPINSKGETENGNRHLGNLVFKFNAVAIPTHFCTFPRSMRHGFSFQVYDLDELLKS